MKKIFYISIFILTYYCAHLNCESGMSSSSILVRPLGSRSSAMGQAFTAISKDSEVVMYNPAGLNSQTKSLYLSYMNGISGGGYAFSSTVFQIKKLTISPSFTSFNSGTIDLNLSDGTNNTVTAESDKVFMLSCSYEVSTYLSVGASLKYTKIELAETASASAINYDIGVNYKLEKNLTLGFAVLNNGKGMKFEDIEDKSPRLIRSGIAYKIELTPPNLLDKSVDLSYSDFIFTFDLTRQREEKTKYQAGMEMNMKMTYDVGMSLRAGWLFNRENEGITFGFSINGENWDFGFAIESSKEFDSRKIFSISYKI